MLNALQITTFCGLVGPVHHGCGTKSPMTEIAQKSRLVSGLCTNKTAGIYARSRSFSGISAAKVQPRCTSKGHVGPMGTIIERKRKDGTTGYTAQIVKKKDGKVIWHESETFDRRQAANAWLARREAELAIPGAMQRPEDPKLAKAIDRYISESMKAIGRTKAQVLETIKRYDIADLSCSKVTSSEIIAFAKVLPVSPATVQNYLSHLGAVFKIARPAWGYPLSYQAMEDAYMVASRLGLTSKSRQRDRRPTLDELDLLMPHFGLVKARRPATVPMQKIVVFAIFSTRRQEEITRIKWTDFDEAHSRVLVRDMKHPGDKIGNDTWCDLTPEAVAIIKSMPRKAKEIFPYSTDAISASFTRACYATSINTPDMPDDIRLHFHDLRHDGISRLFEIGWHNGSIPHVAAVSGHRSWQSLQRYTHLKQAGDKYAGWKWREIWE